VLLGRDGSTDLTLARSDASLDLLHVPSPTESLDRTELAAQRAQVEALQHQVAVARGALRPAVQAFASYEHSQGWERSGDGDGWLAGVAAEWTIFDGQRHRSTLVAAQARLETARAEGGWVDVTRADIPTGKLYSWWSYRARDWDAADKGRRLDHIWASADIAGAAHGSRILRPVRGWTQPSDHVPVLATFDL
jgi:hypothetical protein